MKLGDTLDNCPSWRPPTVMMGGRLASVFDQAAAGPIPDRLAELMEALETALQKGELSPPHRGLL